MPTFIKTGFWEKAKKGYKEWLNLDELIQSLIPTSGTVSSVTGFGVDNTDPSNPIVNKFTTSLNLTATGTNRATAAPITSVYTRLNNGGANTGVILPSLTNVGDKYYIYNTTDTFKKLYAGVDVYVNGTLVDTFVDGAILLPNAIYSFTYMVGGIISMNQEQVAPYQVYSAEFSQSGTSAPTVVVKQNQVGNIVWSRSGAGDYRGTLTGAFSSANFLTSQIIYLGNNGAFGGVAQAFITKLNNNQIRMQTQRGDLTNVDDLLINSFIEIRVYN